MPRRREKEFGDYPVRRNDGTDNPFKADPVPPFAETADSPSGVASGNVPSAGGADFVAAVPQDTAIESSADMTVDRLPGDKILSEEEIENALYDPTLDLSSYQRPPLELLEDHTVEVSVTSEEIVENKNRTGRRREKSSNQDRYRKATIGLGLLPCTRSSRRPACGSLRSRTWRTISR